MFESWRGRYADSPKALSETVAVKFPATQLNWVISDPTQLPSNTVPVKRHSADYFRKLLTTDLLVTNDIVSKHLVKGPQVTYLQCWHGTPLKKVGFDESHPGSKSFATHMKRVVRDVKKWDYLISPSPVCSGLLRSAFRYEGPILETGYPRNDILKSERAASVREAVRAQFGIQADQLVVLYAPTWRDDARDEHGRLRDTSALDYRLLADALPAGTVILNRLHAVVHDVAATWQDERLTVLNVSKYPDIADLYLASDVLVSDYSSAIYDFAVTGKPIILYAYDLTEYSKVTRGLYFEYEHWAPGPIATNITELATELLALANYRERFGTRYHGFTERFCPLEDGKASQRVLEAILG